MKCNVLATCEPGRAGRAAVDAGGLHGIYKRIVRSFIPMEQGVPTLLLGEIGLLEFGFRGLHDRSLSDLQVHYTSFLALKFDHI
jgi:hypothetical protein